MHRGDAPGSLARFPGGRVGVAIIYSFFPL